MESPDVDNGETCIEDSKTTSTTKTGMTVGEELYQVHLSRFENQERSAADFDYERPSCSTPRKRSVSAGEELWLIHCKRSKGIELDEDLEEDEHNNNASDEQKRSSAPSKTGGNSNGTAMKRRRGRRNEIDTGRVIHLRTRDIMVHE